MLVMFVAFLIAAFALLCIRVPSVWSALMAIDEPSDPHELGLVVASRASYPIHTPSPPLTLMLCPLLNVQETLSVKVALRHAWPSSS
jgi:hypothetical protein